MIKQLYSSGKHGSLSYDTDGKPAVPAALHDVVLPLATALAALQVVLDCLACPP